MYETVQDQFESLRKLGAPEINQALIAQLEARAAKDGGTSGKGACNRFLLKANLARRAGNIAVARDAFRAYLRATSGNPSADLPRHAVTPPGLKSAANESIAPVLIIDDLFSAGEMRQLHQHACDLEPKFRKATTNSAKPILNTDKRQTLVTYEFEYKREFFLDFIRSNLAEFQQSLGLPAFEIDRFEIKMTCHVDGGFFKIHSDNHEEIGEAGRALTWLYYFSEDPPQYDGGELYILDSDLQEKTHSSLWFTRVEARPNRFVAFPSWYWHAVGPTHLHGSEFAGGRFAISSHIRKPADGLDWVA